MKIKTNMIQEIFEAIPESEQGSWANADIETWMQRQAPDGSFIDIDYLDSNHGSWGPLNAMTRSLDMLIATQMPKNRLYLDWFVEKAALKAIHFVATGSWWHFNWWTLEIGYPLTTYKVLLLAGSKLDWISRNYLMSTTLMGHLTKHPSQWPANGQNLIWFSEVTIALGVLFEREDWVHQAVAALSQELGVGRAQGIQEDFSFFQHGKLFYSGGYGLNFSKDASRMFKLLRGSSLSFSQKNYEVLSRYILDGQLWLIHGKTIDASSLGRTYARANAASAQGLLPACHEMAKVTGTWQSEFVKCEKTIKEGKKNGKNGNRYFWKSDFMTHNQNSDSEHAFGISVRMNSSRTLNADASPLGEGLKSHHLAEGLTFIHRDGSEYENIFPIFDFNRLPGVTNEYQSIYPEVLNHNYEPHFGTTDFVGGVSDGSNGLATFDLKNGKLSAKKTWFFFESGMVALGAGIHDDSSLPVYTSINQEWAKTPIEYEIRSSQNSKIEIKSLDSGQVRSSELAWASANHTGYLFISKNKITLQNQIQSGSWQSLAAQLSPEVIQGKVMSLWIEHEHLQEADSYAYAVLPNVEVQKLAVLASEPPFQILSNTVELQAVLFPSEKRVQLVFYQPGKLSWNEGHSELIVDRAIALQLQVVNSQIEFSVASPDQKTKEVNIRYEGIFSKNGKLKLLLPQGEHAGDSVRIQVK